MPVTQASSVEASLLQSFDVTDASKADRRIIISITKKMFGKEMSASATRDRATCRQALGELVNRDSAPSDEIPKVHFTPIVTKTNVITNKMVYGWTQQNPKVQHGRET